MENGSLKELHIPHCAATSLARAPKQVLGLRLLYGVGKGGRPRRHTKEVLYVYQQEKLQVLPEIRSISGSLFLFKSVLVKLYDLPCFFWESKANNSCKL